MSKRYSDTINPQIAVQDYLDDLLQKLPSTSPLDKLRQEEEGKAALAAANQKAQQAPKNPSLKTEVRVRPQPTYTTVSSSYSAGRETSLAAQRLEQKRALGRASLREFREPLTIKPSPLLKVMPALQVATREETPQLDEKRSEPSDVRDVSKAARVADTGVAEKAPEIEREKITNAVQPQLGAPKRVEVPEPTLLHPSNKQTGEQPAADLVENEVIAPAEEYSDKWLENGRPEWAQGRFECLIFTVAGLKLAVPLVSLGAIHTMDQELTPLVGRPGWFLGLLPVGDKNIRVVDSALWIMPERYNERVKDGYRFVIRLDNSEWGMACDSVAQSFSISPEEVRWRTDRGKRPWLAGTVIDHMCALMDVAAVAHLLDTAEKTNHSPI